MVGSTFVSNLCNVKFALQDPVQRRFFEGVQGPMPLRVDAKRPQQPAVPRLDGEEPDFLATQKVSDDLADGLQRVGPTHTLTKPSLCRFQSRILTVARSRTAGTHLGVLMAVGELECCFGISFRAYSPR
jgi:hypothetical protein